MKITHIAIKNYRSLKDISLPVDDYTALVGANGAGKSTLLAAAAGLLRPARGRILDRPTVIGWLPERLPPEQPFTALEYLVTCGRVRGLGEDAARRAAVGWAGRLGLTPVLGVRLAELSKGTVQKVALAQALLVRPGLLVLDEPADGLDADTRDRLPAIVTELAAEGATILVSDHLDELAGLPGAVRCLVTDGRVEAEPTAASGRCVIEVAASADGAAAAVAALRAAGHEVLRVREEQR
jgi:ABC-type multidrug transport system ATPase subunit